MKRIIASIIALTAATQAHALALGLVSFGMKAGPSSFSYGYDSYAGTSSGIYMSSNSEGYSVGYTAGPAVDVGVGPISILADLLYSYRKSSLNLTLISGTTTSGTWNIKRHILTLPVQAKWSVLGPLAVTGGAYWSYALKNDVSFSGFSPGSFIYEGLDVPLPSSSTHSNSWENNNDFGFVVGAQFSFMMFSIEGRYMQGLRNIMNASADNKAKSFEFLAGYWF